MSKYHATRTIVEGLSFHSKREAARYVELRLLERAGEIRELELQPIFRLFVVSLDGRVEHECGHYASDFKYLRMDNGEWIVEDVKGMMTPIYRLKKKMVEGIYGIQILETK